MKLQEIKEKTKGKTYEHNGQIIEVAGVTRQGDNYLFGVKNGGFVAVHYDNLDVFLANEIDPSLATVKQEINQVNVERGLGYVPNANIKQMGDGLMDLFKQIQTAEGEDLKEVIERSKSAVSIANTLVSMEKLTVDAVKIMRG